MCDNVQLMVLDHVYGGGRKFATHNDEHPKCNLRCRSLHDRGVTDVRQTLKPIKVFVEDRVGTKSRLNFVKVCDDRSRTQSYDLQTYAIDTVETLIGNVRIDSIDCCMQAIETILVFLLLIQ